jgi:hypothetical protein
MKIVEQTSGRGLKFHGFPQKIPLFAEKATNPFCRWESVVRDLEFRIQNSFSSLHRKDWQVSLWNSKRNDI